jgi:hypothetical protein
LRKGNEKKKKSQQDGGKFQHEEEEEEEGDFEEGIENRKYQGYLAGQ